MSIIDSGRNIFKDIKDSNVELGRLLQAIDHLDNTVSRENDKLERKLEDISDKIQALNNRISKVENDFNSLNNKNDNTWRQAIFKLATERPESIANLMVNDEIVTHVDRQTNGDGDI